MMIIRTTTESDLDRVLSALARQSVNTTTPERYEEYLQLGIYRPGWTWLAEDGDRLLGLAVWWGPSDADHPVALDALWADPSVVDPSRVWAELIRSMVDGLPADAERPEYHVFLPGDWRGDLDIVAQLTPRREAAAAAGLTVTTERLRYEWTPESAVPERSSRLTFVPEPDDEVFVDLFARVTEGSLDAGTAREVARGGAVGAARQELRVYRSMPGDRDWWRVAQDADGGLVGFAMPSANDGGPVVGYLGVLPEHRGHGYVDDLLAEITVILAEGGAERIRADTDLGNVPMAAAFERAGYVNFAIRLVSSLPGA